MQLLLQKKNGFKFINLLFECFMPTSNILDLLIYDSVITIRAYKNARFPLNNPSIYLLIAKRLEVYQNAS